MKTLFSFLLSQCFCLCRNINSNFVELSGHIWKETEIVINVPVFHCVLTSFSFRPAFPVSTLESSVSSFWWCSVATTQRGASEIFMLTHILTPKDTHSPPFLFAHISSRLQNIIYLAPGLGAKRFTHSHVTGCHRYGREFVQNTVQHFSCQLCNNSLLQLI